MDELDQVLVVAQQRGLIGPAPVADHRRHAVGFGAGWAVPPGALVDLGSGGGIPGLVLAWDHPDLEVCLVDGRRRSADWLAEAVARLGLTGRVRVDPRRAEDFGRDETERGDWPMVVARGFGPPAVVAECAGPLLRPDGVLVVSEPPAPDPQRWSVSGLADLGLARGRAWSTEAGRYQQLDRCGPCPDRYPRRVGIPSKRPLW